MIYLPEDEEERDLILEEMDVLSLLFNGRAAIGRCLSHIELFGDKADRIFIHRNLITSDTFLEALKRRIP